MELNSYDKLPNPDQTLMKSSAQHFKKIDIYKIKEKEHKVSKVKIECAKEKIRQT